MHQRGTATAVTDNKNRLFDFLPPQARKQDVVEKEEQRMKDINQRQQHHQLEKQGIALMPVDTLLPPQLAQHNKVILQVEIHQHSAVLIDGSDKVSRCTSHRATRI